MKPEVPKRKKIRRTREEIEQRKVARAELKALMKTQQFVLCIRDENDAALIAPQWVKGHRSSFYVGKATAMLKAWRTSPDRKGKTSLDTRYEGAVIACESRADFIDLMKILKRRPEYVVGDKCVKMHPDWIDSVRFPPNYPSKR